MGLFDLFRLKWKNSDPDVRLEAAKELDDLGVLSEMASSDPNWFVRHSVFSLIRDKKPSQELLTKLAQTASDEEIRRKSIKLLLSERTLERIIATEKYTFVREAAEHRLEELRSNLWGEKDDVPAAAEGGSGKAAAEPAG